jgi:hypothetical protein
MRTTVKRWARSAAIMTAAVGMMLGGAAVANADEWPPVPNYPTPLVPFETKGFLTPTDLDYWNPLVSMNRLTSPFGTSTRIVCTAFHGVTLDCWQADQSGNPHKLVRLPFNFPAITGWQLPGGGPSHFVYPFWS